MIIIFWLCIGMIGYAYIGFPLLLALRAQLFPRSYQRQEITPTVSVIIAAHNEAEHIQAKLQNVLAVDYPNQQIEIIVASDGSTDDTDQIVRQFAPQVKLLSLPRRGKAAALNAAIRVSTGELLVFTDANSMFQESSLRALVAPLCDTNVGGVAGDQRYVSNRKYAAQEGECRYWDFDRLLKRWQSRAGNVTSATGAIYAIRRKLFTTVPEGVTDDFAISTDVIRQGQRLVFAEDAVACEEPAQATSIEFGRKVRIMTRGLWGVIERRSLLNPFAHGFYSVQLFSHKVARRLVAIPLCALFVASLGLWNAGSLYQLAAASQLSLYSAALCGLVLRNTATGHQRILSIPLFFCLVNVASLVAVGNIVAGRRIITWNPTRQSEPVQHVAGAS